MAYKKDEDDGPRNPFLGLEKSTVLQEARSFNDMPINVRKCIHILTKLLFLIHQGDTFGTREATETFFSMTKLFQCPNVTLRRMVYLTIKAMSTISEDVIMVTSSLMKDMTGGNDSYRGASIRALCTITDSTTLQSLERFLKQAIVDRNSSVSSGALVSSLHLLTQGQDVVKRWVNEVQQAASNNSYMAQYHALGLLYHVKQKDRLAVQKLVTTQTRKHLSSPFAACLLIRYAMKVIETDTDSGTAQDLYEYLESCLRNKHEMVVYEAARAIVNIKDVTARQLAPAVSVLQLFLSSPRPVLRFAAVRTLNKVSISHPNAVKTCVLDMENLITDSNRSVATLAITTLLKIGNEASVDRLMKQISSFMHEISDEFKIVVVEAIRSLCLKYPQKYPVLMNFLATALRDEGGFEYKRAIVGAISGIIEHVPEAKESGLAQLCEYIEDCEHPSLLTTILHLLGERGPTTTSPGKYIRFIYNRLILESSLVRAAAVDALSKFGMQCESLRSSIEVLLRRCLMDGDDEVRDRVTFALTLLTDATSNSSFVNQLPLSVSALERALSDYLASPAEAPFDIKSIPIDTSDNSASSKLDDMFEPVEAELVAASKPNAGAQRAATEARLAAVPEFAELGLGPLFSSSDEVMLTESETEYVVKARKHIFAERVVFEYNINNTLNDQILENCHVDMQGGEQEIDADDVVIIPAAVVKYDEPAFTYVSFPHDATFTSQSFDLCLEFLVKDCDPETGETDPEGYDDKYELEEIELGFADFISGAARPNFAATWQSLEDNEAEDVFELSSMESLQEAIDQVSALLGMTACEKSDTVKDGKLRHELFLSGVYVGGHDVLVRAQLAHDEHVSMKLAVRASDPTLCDLVMQCIA